MRRYVPLVAVACLLGAATGCGGSAPTAPLPPGPAPRQDTTLDWVEQTPANGPALTFSADRFQVTADGWIAVVGIENGTAVRWILGGATPQERVVGGSAFGVMVFPTRSLADVGDGASDGAPPPVRRAARIVPALPPALQPGASWHGTISGSGRLPAGLFVRISFGPLWTTATPPKGLPGTFSWISDHAVALRRDQ